MTDDWRKKRKRGSSMQTITIEGEVTTETDKAYLFAVDDWEVWLPKSQCEWNENDKIMTIPEWLARERELM